MKEIEILLEVKSDKESALRALERFSSQGVKKTLDIYFYDPLREDLKPDVSNKLGACFRLRQKSTDSYLAYKTDHFLGDAWSHSDEFETKVESIEVTLQIIEKLGFKELIRIDNEKHTYLTPDYEIVLEDVQNLGLFLEIEKLQQVADENVSKTKEEMRLFLTNLNIEFGTEQNAGKPELMLRKKSLL